MSTTTTPSAEIRTAGCAPGTMRDFWFVFPPGIPSAFGGNTTAAMADAAFVRTLPPCDVSIAAFQAANAVFAVLVAGMSLAALGGALAARAADAKKQMFACLPHGLCALVLLTGSCDVSSTASASEFWALGNVAWIMLGCWGSFTYFHILANTSVIKRLATQLVPLSLRREDGTEDAFAKLVENDAAQNAAMVAAGAFMTLSLVCFAVMVPVSRPPNGVPWSDRPDPGSYKDMYVFIGALCHPIGTVLFISIPLRHLRRLGNSLRKTRTELAKALNGSNNPSASGGHGAIAGNADRDSQVRAFEKKLFLGEVQGYVSALLSQSLWIVGSDARALGLRTGSIYVLLFLGFNFFITMLLMYLPKKLIPKRVWEALHGAKTSTGTAPSAKSSSVGGGGPVSPLPGGSARGRPTVTATTRVGAVPESSVAREEGAPVAAYMPTSA